MCKGCGNAVQSLLKGRGVLPTLVPTGSTILAKPAHNPQVFHISSQIHSQNSPHPKTTTSPLFEQVFYPVSTEPIITKKRLRKVYNNN